MESCGTIALSALLFLSLQGEIEGAKEGAHGWKKEFAGLCPFAFCLGSVVALPSQKSGWVSLLSPLDVSLQSRAHEAALQILHWPPKASDRS